MIDFDLQSYAKRVAPADDYVMRVNGIPELKHTKANNGSRYLEVWVKVVEGAMSGHTIPVKFNLYNASPTAERIARERFWSFCESAGIPHIKNYSQLDGCTLMGKVIVTSYEGNPKNEIESFYKYGGSIRIPEEKLTSPEPALNDDIPF